MILLDLLSRFTNPEKARKAKSSPTRPLPLPTPPPSESESLEASYRVINSHPKSEAAISTMIYHILLNVPPEERSQICEWASDLGVANNIMAIQYIRTIPSEIRESILRNGIEIKNSLAKCDVSPECIVNILKFSYSLTSEKANAITSMIKEMRLREEDFSHLFDRLMLLDSRKRSDFFAILEKIDPKNRKDCAFKALQQPTNCVQILKLLALTPQNELNTHLEKIADQGNQMIRDSNNYVLQIDGRQFDLQDPASIWQTIQDSCIGDFPKAFNIFSQLHQGLFSDVAREWDIWKMKPENSTCAQLLMGRIRPSQQQRIQETIPKTELLLQFDALQTSLQGTMVARTQDPNCSDNSNIGNKIVATVHHIWGAAESNIQVHFQVSEWQKSRKAEPTS